MPNCDTSNALLCSVRLAAATVVFKTKKSRVHRRRFKAVAAASAALVDTPGSAVARSFNCRSLGSNDSNSMYYVHHPKVTLLLLMVVYCCDSPPAFTFW